METLKAPHACFIDSCCLTQQRSSTSLHSVNFMPAPLFDDVITEILGFLHNDHQTLKVCTLTSRSWYLLSREFLHTKLCVDSRCETRLEFYKNRPDLSGLIQNLVIVLSVEGLCSKLENMHFPKLSTLFLTGSNRYHGGYNDNTLSGSLLDYFMKKPTLKRLCIKDTKLPIDRLVPFISSFPRLTSISLHCVSNAKETTDKHLDTCAQTKPVSAMKSLRHLRIDSSSGSLALVQFIQKLEVSPPIAYATLRIVPYRQWNRNIGDWFMHTVSSPTVKGIRLEERSGYTELQWTIEGKFRQKMEPITFSHTLFPQKTILSINTTNFVVSSLCHTTTRFYPGSQFSSPVSTLIAYREW